MVSDSDIHQHIRNVCKLVLVESHIPPRVDRMGELHTVVDNRASVDEPRLVDRRASGDRSQPAVDKLA